MTYLRLKGLKDKSIVGCGLFSSLIVNQEKTEILLLENANTSSEERREGAEIKTTVKVLNHFSCFFPFIFVCHLAIYNFVQQL